MSSNYLRTISIASPDKIYHRRSCSYAARIKGMNKLIIPKREAAQMGYRPCKCCHSVKRNLKKELDALKNFAKRNDMELHFMQSALYAKTKIGLWKIYYSEKNQKYILFHANCGYANLAIKEADTARYHRQIDVKHSDTAMEYMKYIYKHDRYRMQVQAAGGNEMMVKVEKKYAVQRERRMKRQARRRVDALFAKIESEHSEYAQLAFC